MKKVEKPISEKQKMFVRAIVCDGLRQGEAYKKCFGNVKFPDSRASYLLKKTSILKYYNSLSAQMEKQAIERGLWTRELATQALWAVLDRARKEIKDGVITRASVMAIIKSVKELNKIYGLYTSQNIARSGVIFADDVNISVSRENI